MKSDQLQIRINPELKQDLEPIFEALGITFSQAVTMFLHQVKMNNGLPFDLRIGNTPNALTAETIRKSMRGEAVHSYDSLEAWEAHHNGTAKVK